MIAQMTAQVSQRGTAIIAGGGIGGLTAALSLHHFGWNARVIERATAFEEAGAGVQLSPNAMRVFAVLGLAQRIVAAGFLPGNAQMRDGVSGRVIFTLPLGASARNRWGADYVHIHRADLHAILVAALNDRMPHALSAGTAVTAYGQDAASAWAMTGTEKVCGDIVIGADGIHSALRAQMTGNDAARFTGHMAWRAVVPVDRLGKHAPPPDATVWTGAGRHAVTYLLRGGALANLVGVVERRDWREESWMERGTRDDALADFAGWHPAVSTLIANADAHYRWAIYDRRPPRLWYDGRIVLMGDACHPMSPFMAQGAAMAVEDAFVLARILDEHGPYDAPADYTAHRRARVARVINAARDNARLYHRATPLSRAADSIPLRLASIAAPALPPHSWTGSMAMTLRHSGTALRIAISPQARLCCSAQSASK